MIGLAPSIWSFENVTVVTNKSKHFTVVGP